jgi:hypothetical protein
MFSFPRSANKVLPYEYRNAAEALFPSAEGKGPSEEAACAFADILGIGENYRKLWNVCKTGKTTGGFLDSFQNNLDLLIQKTWVEKSEETRKEDLLDKVQPFIHLIENGEYPNALEEFGAILEELAYLFFGAQSQKDDFTEYALRIDPLFGLFWWYGGQLNSKHDSIKNLDPKIQFALLLLGICYLTDF